GLADKRQGDIIDAQLKAHFDVREVLGRQRGQADLDSGQIYVPAAAEGAFGENFALDLVAVLGQDLHLNRAVVQQDHVAEVDVPGLSHTSDLRRQSYGIRHE